MVYVRMLGDHIAAQGSAPPDKSGLKNSQGESSNGYQEEYADLHGGIIVGVSDTASVCRFLRIPIRHFG